MVIVVKIVLKYYFHTKSKLKKLDFYLFFLFFSCFGIDKWLLLD